MHVVVGFKTSARFTPKLVEAVKKELCETDGQRKPNCQGNYVPIGSIPKNSTAYEYLCKYITNPQKKKMVDDGVMDHEPRRSSLQIAKDRYGESLSGAPSDVQLNAWAHELFDNMRRMHIEDELDKPDRERRIEEAKRRGERMKRKREEQKETATKAIGGAFVAGGNARNEKRVDPKARFGVKTLISPTFASSSN